MSLSFTVKVHQMREISDAEFRVMAMLAEAGTDANAYCSMDWLARACEMDPVECHQTLANLFTRRNVDKECYLLGSQIDVGFEIFEELAK